MSFKRNIPGWERAVRAALGVGLLAVVWIMPLTGLVGWIVGLAIDPVPVGLQRDLGAMIAALPNLYREVLILRDIEELTAPEAASELGISVEAVKSRLHRARSLLREKLLNAGYWTS